MVNIDLDHKNIFLDTAPLIYFIEGNSQYQEKLEQIFKSNDNGDFAFIASSITLLEVLVKPLKEGRNELAKKYINILTGAKGIEVFEITNDIAIKAAELRAKYNLKTPDAIQLATAIECNADYFLTNDLRLKLVTEVKCIVLTEL
jgi:predicted nucleic acid-binding protein